MAEAPQIRLALADDQPLVLRGLTLLLREFADLEITLTATNADDLLAGLEQSAVDVVVCDIRMPGRSGIEIVRALRARHDATPVILLTTFNEDGLLQGAIDAGAQGFLLKDAIPSDLHAAIVRVAGGGTLLEPVSFAPLRRLSDDAEGDVPHLTEREISILRLIAGGYPNREIGRLLYLSEGTVKNYVSDILAKLKCRDRTHAVLTAISRRLL